MEIVMSLQGMGHLAGGLALNASNIGYSRTEISHHYLMMASAN